jgi:polyhydroxybutyrate depolymerase
MRTGPSTSKIAVVAAVGLLLAGCGFEARASTTNQSPQSPRPGDHRATMMWDGKERAYTVHAPPGYTPRKKLPLVIAMHPYPSDGSYVAQLSGLNAKADKEGFLVAYPDGYNQAYNALVCCGSEDDVGFIGAMTKRLLAHWRADADRVYATGISNGGDMAFKLAVELPGTLAAIAPVSAGYIGASAADPTYMPKTPVSVVTFIGGLDAYGSAMREGAQTWQKRLACKAGPPRKLEGGDTRTSAKCRDRSEFVTYLLPKMGHKWPGSNDPYMGYPETGVNATDLIWKFFKAHPQKSS